MRGDAPGRRGSVRTLVLTLATAGCTAGALGGCMAGAGPAPGAATTEGPTRASPEAAAPDDFAGTGGSLRQEEITIRFDLPELELRLTPLDPGILALTAPDTRRRLGTLAPDGDAVVFLVSAFTTTPGGVEFEPREVVLENRGRRYRPVSIRGLTPGWGTQLVQDRPEQALYSFPGDIDLELPFAVEFRGRRNDQWRTILPRLDAERARMRARGGSPAPTSSP